MAWLQVRQVQILAIQTFVHFISGMCASERSKCAWHCTCADSKSRDGSTRRVESTDFQNGMKICCNLLQKSKHSEIKQKWIILNHDPRFEVILLSDR